MKFQVGDRVEIIDKNDRDYGKQGVIKIIDRSWVYLFGLKLDKPSNYFLSGDGDWIDFPKEYQSIVKPDQLKLISRKGETMSEYDEIKVRIDNITGETSIKEVDDILERMYDYKNSKNDMNLYFIAIPAWKVEGDSIKIIHMGNIQASFIFNTQCQKLIALKSALTWLLNHSDIKKDGRQEKIAELERRQAELQKEIEELKK
ncbi:MAG: hypothetical protein WC312_03710 [Candidatus Omnitrophota bacterium]|jgi:hypothetical protein